MFEVIREDLARIAKPTFSNAVKWYFLPRGECFPLNVWLRTLQFWRRAARTSVFPVSSLCSLMAALAYPFYRHYEFKFGVHPNANAEIGGGLRVVHGPCSLNAARIGRNFTVYPGVTVGRHRGGVPSIGDDVGIYPNSVVVGGIDVGDGAVIGALSYVDKSVAPGMKTNGRFIS